MRVKVTGEVGVQTFVSWNQLIWESKSRHERSFLEPEDSAERPGEKDSLNGSEGNQSFMEWFLFVHPFHSPLSFLFNDVNILNSVKKIGFLVLVLDISIDQERVGLGMNVLHGYLEPIKTSGLRNLNFWTELFGKIFHNDSVTGGKKCQNIFYEMLFIGIEFLPVFKVLVKVYFIGSPKWSKMLFVHFVDGMVLDGEENEPLGVFFHDWLFNVRGAKNSWVFHKNLRFIPEYSRFKIYYIFSLELTGILML